MGSKDLNELKRKTEKLNPSEKLQLIAYLVEQCRVTTQTKSQRRKWEEIGGKAPYPLANEDAQEWVSRTRAESDAKRSRY
jgi:hypothetical protein